MTAKEDPYTRKFLQERYPAAVSISLIARELGMNRGPDWQTGSGEMHPGFPHHF
jgi:hypothetical protein